MSVCLLVNMCLLFRDVEDKIQNMAAVIYINFETSYFI